MSVLLAIDPGKQLGWAVFRNSTLVRCGLVLNASVSSADEITSLVHDPDIVIVEKPQIYQGRRQKGDPNDLIGLAMIIGVVGGRYPRAKLLTPTPREWKGTVPKFVVEQRVRNQLALSEKTTLGLGTVKFRKSWQHNIIDAVGIGLWGLGRVAA